MGKQPGIIIFNSDYENVCRVLSNEQKGILLDALINFGQNGELYSGNDLLLQIAFNVLSAVISRNIARYEQRCKRNQENIRKRWIMDKKTNTNVYDGIQLNTNSYESAETEIQTQTKRQNKTRNIYKKSLFTPPTIDEVTSYCQERRNGINAAQFIDYYQARGWELKPGQKIKDWKACIRTWERNNQKGGVGNVRGYAANQTDGGAIQRTDYSFLQNNIEKV